MKWETQRTICNWEHDQHDNGNGNAEMGPETSSERTMDSGSLAENDMQLVTVAADILGSNTEQTVAMTPAPLTDANFNLQLAIVGETEHTRVPLVPINSFACLAEESDAPSLSDTMTTPRKTIHRKGAAPRTEDEVVREITDGKQGEDRTNSPTMPMDWSTSQAINALHTSTPMDWSTSQAINALHTSTPMNWQTPEAINALTSTIARIDNDALLTEISSLLVAKAAKVGQNTVDDEHEVTTIQPPAKYGPQRSSRSKKTNPKFR